MRGSSELETKQSTGPEHAVSSKLMFLRAAARFWAPRRTLVSHQKHYTPRLAEQLNSPPASCLKGIGRNIFPIVSTDQGHPPSALVKGVIGPRLLKGQFMAQNWSLWHPGSSLHFTWYQPVSTDVCACDPYPHDSSANNSSANVCGAAAPSINFLRT